MQWARDAGERGSLNRREDFFQSSLCKTWFRRFITHVLSRVNTVTGTAYKDEPAIFAWELINGARTTHTAGTQQLAHSWHAHAHSLRRVSSHPSKSLLYTPILLGLSLLLILL